MPLGARSPHARFSPCLLVCSSAAGFGLCITLQATDPQWRLQRAAATWALAMGCGLVVGPARARVEPCGGHGYAVHARLCVLWWAGLTGVQRPGRGRCWRGCGQP